MGPVVALLLAQAWLEAPELQQVRAQVNDIDSALDASVREQFQAQTTDHSHENCEDGDSDFALEHHLLSRDGGTWERWHFRGSTGRGCSETSNRDVIEETVWLRDRQPLFVLRTTALGDMTRIDTETRWWFGPAGAPVWSTSSARGFKEGQRIDRRSTAGSVSGFDGGVKVPLLEAPCAQLGVLGDAPSALRVQSGWCALTGTASPRPLPSFTILAPPPLPGRSLTEEVWSKVASQVPPLNDPGPSETPRLRRQVTAPGVSLDVAFDQLRDGVQLRTSDSRHAVWTQNVGSERVTFELLVGPWGTVERRWLGTRMTERWLRPGKPTEYRFVEGKKVPAAPKVEDLAATAKAWR
jgi:hypothetical protein